MKKMVLTLTALTVFNQADAMFLNTAKAAIRNMPVAEMRSLLQNPKTIGTFKAIEESATRQLNGMVTQTGTRAKALKEICDAAASARGNYIATKMGNIITAKTANNAFTLFEKAKLPVLLGVFTAQVWNAGKDEATRPTISQILKQQDGPAYNGDTRFNCLTLHPEVTLRDVLKPCHTDLATPRQTIPAKPRKTLSEVLKFDAPRPTSHPLFAIERDVELSQETPVEKVATQEIPATRVPSFRIENPLRNFAFLTQAA